MRTFCTLPCRLCSGSASAGTELGRLFVNVCGRKSWFWWKKLYVTLAFTLVRSGRLTPPDRLKVFARLLGGSDVVPNWGPPTSTELQGASDAGGCGGTVEVFAHGLSARMYARSFSNTERV